MRQNRVFVFAADPWGGRRIVRDVTDLTTAELEALFLFQPLEFEKLTAKARERGLTPGQAFASWVDQVGEDSARVVFVHAGRRIRWLNIGAAIGLFAGFFFSPWDFGLWDSSPNSVSRLLRLGASIILALCAGAGAGWFAGSIADTWQNRRAWRTYEAASDEPD